MKVIEILVKGITPEGREPIRVFTLDKEAEQEFECLHVYNDLPDGERIFLWGTKGILTAGLNEKSGEPVLFLNKDMPKEFNKDAGTLALCFGSCDDVLVMPSFTFTKDLYTGIADLKKKSAVELREKIVSTLSEWNDPALQGYIDMFSQRALPEYTFTDMVDLLV